MTKSEEPIDKLMPQERQEMEHQIRAQLIDQIIGTAQGAEEACLAVAFRGRDRLHAARAETGRSLEEVATQFWASDMSQRAVVLLSAGMIINTLAKGEQAELIKVASSYAEALLQEPEIKERAELGPSVIMQVLRGEITPEYIVEDAEQASGESDG